MSPRSLSFRIFILFYFFLFFFFGVTKRNENFQSNVIDIFTKKGEEERGAARMKELQLLCFHLLMESTENNQRRQHKRHTGT